MVIHPVLTTLTINTCGKLDCRKTSGKNGSASYTFQRGEGTGSQADTDQSSKRMRGIDHETTFVILPAVPICSRGAVLQGTHKIERHGYYM